MSVYPASEKYSQINAAVALTETVSVKVTSLDDFEDFPNKAITMPPIRSTIMIGAENNVEIKKDPAHFRIFNNAFSVSYTHLDVYKRQVINT